MMTLAIHEVRMIGRRPVWAAAVILHAAATSMFAAVWGPLGGISLWQANVLQQLVAADWMIIAVLLPWLATFVLTDDDNGARSLVEWSALTGQQPGVVACARLAAASVFAAVFMSAALPAFVAAAQVSAAPTTELLLAIGAAFGFAVFALGGTAIAGLIVRNRVGVWCTAMVVALAAVAGIRQLESAALRGGVPAAAGLILLAGFALARRSWRRDGDR